jgi:hypothetical protein
VTAPRVGRFVDVDKLLIAWLTSRGRRAGTRLPDPIPDDFVWVTAVGGPSDYDIAVARFDLHTFRRGAPGAAMPVAELAHQDMATLDGQTVGGQPVYTVRCPRMPTPQFWSPDVDRVVATYEMDLPVL